MSRCVAGVRRAMFTQLGTRPVDAYSMMMRTVSVGDRLLGLLGGGADVVRAVDRRSP